MTNNLQKNETKKFPLPWGRNGRAAFTLAEVLITLGVIGVVAAMTMPMLMANHRKQVVETKLAKFYSSINQAIATSVAHNGEVTSWFIDNSNPATCDIDESITWFKTYIGKYMNISEIKKDAESPNYLFRVYLNDGSLFSITNYISDITYYISEKAANNPQYGINSFNFYFKPSLSSVYGKEFYRYSIHNTVEPYTFTWDGTQEGLVDENNEYSCAGAKHAFCAKLIQMNGWKIPKDYPLKF